MSEKYIKNISKVIDLLAFKIDTRKVFASGDLPSNLFDVLNVMDSKYIR